MNKLLTLIIAFCCITNMFAQTDKVARKRSNQSQCAKIEMTAAQLYSEGVKQFNIFWDSNSQTARSKAISYFERAEKKGNVSSLYYLGRLCWGNEDEKGTGYWTKGAELEDVDCMRELGYKLLDYGMCYGSQTAKKTKGFQFLESASMKGDYKAKLYLGNCYFADNQDEKAMKNWLSVANNSTDEDLKARACREIGDYYFGSIRGRVIDYKKGIEWYEKSASYNVDAGNSTRSVFTRIYFGAAGTRPEYKDLDRCKYWCSRIIARGLRFQIDKEILEYFGL